jgi:hypothetical protein
MMTLYSLSCTGEGGVGSKASGKAFPCASEMIRYEGKNFRLEQWTLPAGDILFEISRKQKIGKEVNPAFEKALRLCGKREPAPMPPVNRNWGVAARNSHVRLAKINTARSRGR